MVLSSDELEILEYLKAWKGESVSMLEISRCAGGRKKFRETPSWAKGLMSRLVDFKLIEVNERGHYRFRIEAHGAVYFSPFVEPVVSVEPIRHEGYVVGDDYFPSTATDSNDEASEQWWLSPQIDELKQSKKNPDAS